MKKQFRYRLLSFLLLFTVVNTAVGGVIDPPGTAQAKEPGKHAGKLSEPASENDLNLIEHLSDPSLCHIQPVQHGTSLASKRTQGFKDLLLMHACKLSKDVKASPADHIRFTDELTHIYLFLFPHHFFW